MARQKDTPATPESLILAFKQQKFLPLYLFSGEEQFLIDEVVDALIDHAVDPSSKSFNLDIVYGGEIDVKDVVAIASSFPMMSERRVAIVRDADKLASSDASRDILMRYLDNPVPSTILVCIAPNADMRLAIFKAFGNHGLAVKFQKLHERAVPNWINRHVQKLGRKITYEACDLLLSRVGTSLAELSNEVDKILIYVGDKDFIDVDDVEAVVGFSKIYNIFELQKAIGKRNPTRAIEILEHMLDAGESPIYIIVMLTKFFQTVWKVSPLKAKNIPDDKIAAELHLYYVSEYTEAARNYAGDAIRKCFEALLEADVKLKSSSEDPKLIMTVALHRILRREVEPIYL